MNFNNILNKLENENEKLATILSNLKISNLYLTSLGNSIGAGYSLQNTTKPLLLRNESLVSKMKDMGIETSLFHFARSQNNSDQHIDRWIETNLSLADMHRYNIADMHKSDTPVKNEDEVLPFYDLSPSFNPGLKDLLINSKQDMANIVIYNGGTGSFLDNITRKGNRFPIYGFKEDNVSIESVIRKIQIFNRDYNANTQVYLCGIPRVLGLKAVDLIVNNNLKKIASSYPNTTYVNSVDSKLFYGNKPFSAPDYHYNEEEYLKFNLNIINQITTSYIYNKALIEIDRLLFNTSEAIEMEKCVFNDQNICQLIEKWTVTIRELGFDENMFLQMLDNYILQYYPSHYYYLDKKDLRIKIKGLKVK